jgi:glutamate synthase (NADPH/NADH) large chain
VRNSGATAVVEGVGDHGCEYMTGGRVVVLGPTGRNFAAGMSGGLAFVLDLDPAKVNDEMRDQLEPVSDTDAIELHALITEHHARTGSPVAQRVLDGWEAHLPRIAKVFPVDYKRVLTELDAAEDRQFDGVYEADEEQGRTVDVVGAPDVGASGDGDSA